MSFSTGSFSITQGDTTYINLVVTDDSGNPLDITGYEFYFTSKLSPCVSDSSSSLYKTQTTHSNAPQGLTSFLINPNDTTGSIPSKYAYDVRFKDTVGNITTLTSDYYYLNPSITDNTNR